MRAIINEYHGGTISRTINLNEQQFKVEICKTSPAYFRAVASGWAFDPVEISQMGNGFILRAPFRCICGKKEMLVSRIYDKFLPKIVDVAARLEKLGSFSVVHLHKDGYSLDEIKRIRQAYI